VRTDSCLGCHRVRSVQPRDREGLVPFCPHGDRVAYVPVYLGLLAVLITFTPSLVALIVGFPSALVGVKLLQGWEVCPRTADVAARKARGETSLRVAIPCHLWNDPAQEADRGKEILRLLTH
jgi:hypothetical protein